MSKGQSHSLQILSFRDYITESSSSETEPEDEYQNVETGTHSKHYNLPVNAFAPECESEYFSNCLEFTGAPGVKGTDSMSVTYLGRASAPDYRYAFRIDVPRDYNGQEHHRNILLPGYVAARLMHDVIEAPKLKGMSPVNKALLDEFNSAH